MSTNTYSLADVQAAINGPGGSFSIGAGVGLAEEGITIQMLEAKNTMTIGGDGTPMHSLHAGRGGTITIRTLKTSQVNALLSTLYNFQTTSSANHGQNTISVRDPTRGDNTTAQTCAFQKLPNMNYAKVGGTNEWVFDAGVVDMIFGTGTPEA